jgi:hypothetical protein
VRVSFEALTPADIQLPYGCGAALRVGVSLYVVQDDISCPSSMSRLGVDTESVVKKKKKLHQPPEEIREALAIPPHKRRKWKNFWGGWGTRTYDRRMVRKPTENHFENPRDCPWLDR